MEFSSYDLFIFLLDIIICVLVIHLVIQSRKVIIDAQVGGKFFIPLLFIGLGLIGFLNYTFPFTIIQAVAMIAAGIGYYFVRSGLAENGLILSGSLLPYEKAGKITLKKQENALYFKQRGRVSLLRFDEDKIDEVRDFLKSRDISNK